MIKQLLFSRRIIVIFVHSSISPYGSFPCVGALKYHFEYEQTLYFNHKTLMNSNSWNVMIDGDKGFE